MKEESKMFTGIIQEIGSVVAATRKGGGVVLNVRAPMSAAEIKVNDSVSLNGVCQTVVSKAADTFEVEAVEETLKKTTLGTLKAGGKVNVELAMRLSDRVGGHLVQGHVDCVGQVSSIEKKSMSWVVRVSYPAEFARYIIPVGSIAVDGVSLTVASLEGSEFTISVIPHTLEMTTLSDVQSGMAVNLEFDLVGKYIERLLTHGGKAGSGEKGGITLEKLAGWGFGA